MIWLKPFLKRNYPEILKQKEAQFDKFLGTNSSAYNHFQKIHVDIKHKFIYSIMNHSSVGKLFKTKFHLEIVGGFKFVLKKTNYFIDDTLTIIKFNDCILADQKLLEQLRLDSSQVAKDLLGYMPVSDQRAIDPLDYRACNSNNIDQANNLQKSNKDSHLETVGDTR